MGLSLFGDGVTDHCRHIRHSEVQLARRVQKTYCGRVTVEVFTNRQSAAREALVSTVIMNESDPILSYGSILSSNRFAPALLAQ